MQQQLHTHHRPRMGHLALLKYLEAHAWPLEACNERREVASVGVICPSPHLLDHSSLMTHQSLSLLFASSAGVKPHSICPGTIYLRGMDLVWSAGS